MEKRPVRGACGTCGLGVEDDHANLRGTRGGGERWRHTDTEAYLERAKAGDTHPATINMKKVAEWAEFWDQADYDAEKKRKRQEEDE